MCTRHSPAYSCAALIVHVQKRKEGACAMRMCRPIFQKMCKHLIKLSNNFKCNAFLFELLLLTISTIAEGFNNKLTVLVTVFQTSWRDFAKHFLLNMVMCHVLIVGIAFNTSDVPKICGYLNHAVASSTPGVSL